MKTAMRIVILALIACVLAGCGQKGTSGKKGEKARTPSVEKELDEETPASGDESDDEA